MKPQPIFLLILLAFGIHVLSAQSVIPSPAAPPANTVTFTPDSFPEFIQKAPEISSYRYFWNFGDGHFKLIDQPNTTVTTDVTQPFTYGYDQTTAANYKTQLQITQIYSPPTKPDDELKVGDSPIIPIGGGTMPATGNDVDMQGGSIVIHPVREVRPGYLMTFIVTYDLNACQGRTWKFTFTYNSFILNAPGGINTDILEGYNDFEIFNTTESSFGGGTDQVVIDITRTTPPDPAGDERYSFFLNFEVSPDVEPGTPLDIMGKFEGIDGAFTNPCGDFLLPDTYVAKSYDPNYKLVSEDTITTNPAQKLHYVIHFQNTGEGPTDSIRIDDYLDPRLDPSTLALTDVRIGYQHVLPADLTANPDPFALASGGYTWIADNPTPAFELTEVMPTATSFSWYLDSAVLHGTKESGYGDAFSELETTGTIEFDIYTCGFMEYGITIENEAEIFFDDNPKVVTEPAQTIKYCCDLLADTLNGASFDINAYFDPSVYPILSSYSFSSDTAPAGSNPSIKVDTAAYRCDYLPFPGGFQGLDVMTVIVCDTNTPPRCDTIFIHICANVTHKLGQYPCDTTTAVCSTMTSINPILISPQAQIRVYPNPANEQVFVDHRGFPFQVKKLTLFNLEGQQLIEISPNNSGISALSLSKLPAGLYILRVNERWSKKIIKR